jgi:hypothetical protein
MKLQGLGIRGILMDRVVSDKLIVGIDLNIVGRF